MESPKKYWCYQCNIECPISYTKIDDEEIPQCDKCKSTFIEEITEVDNPKNFKPEKKIENIKNNEEETLIFLPSTVNCIPVDNSNSIPGIINNFGGLVGAIINYGENLFMTNNLSNTNIPLLGFLNNHNNDAQFENLLNFIMRFESTLHGNPPASQRAIDKLKKVKVNSDNLKQFENITCNICLNNFVIDDNVLILDCHHEFHDNCIVHWLKMRNTCPVCRHELESNDPNYERRKNSHRETLRNFHSTNNNNNGGNNNNNNNNNPGTAV